jgi:hypothetical protein
MDVEAWMRLALDHRLDFRRLVEQVYDRSEKRWWLRIGWEQS